MNDLTTNGKKGTPIRFPNLRRSLCWAVGFSVCWLAGPFDVVRRGCSNTFPVKLNWQQSLATVGANLRNVIRVTVAVACVEGILFELSNNPGDAMRPPLPSNTASLQFLATPTLEKAARSLRS